MTTMAQQYSSTKPQDFSNHIRNVAIIGAGGHIGKHIVDQLLKTGQHTMTAITRPSSTSKIPEGVKIVRLDYTSEDNKPLVNALQGMDALLITMAVTAPKDMVSKLVRAPIEAGVQYVLPNWFGNDAANDSLCNDSMLTPMRDSIYAEFENVTGTSYLMLVCNFWYEFGLGGGPLRYGFDFQKRSFIMFDDGNVKINTSTWPQCGRAIANLLSLKVFPDDRKDESPTLSQFRNKAVYISSFQVSQLDMFHSVKRVTGTTDADWNITCESAKARFEEGQAEVFKGNFRAFPKMLYSRMFFDNGDGDYQSRRGLDNKLLGLPVEDLDEWTTIAVRMGENGEVAHDH